MIEEKLKNRLAELYKKKDEVLAQYELATKEEDQDFLARENARYGMIIMEFEKVLK